MTATPQLIALTTGGTGGHVFPAEALAGVLAARGYRLALLTDTRGKAFSGALAAVPTYGVPAAQMLGRGIGGKALGAARLFLGAIRARGLLKSLRPSVVVGFGGYASVPAMAAAQSLGVKTVLHEQNAVLGRANRLFITRVARAALAFQKVAAVPARVAATQVGMPVRPAIRALYDTPYEPPTGDGDIRVVVLGGSQGARIFSDVLPEAFQALPDALRRRLVISQQARPEDLMRVTAAYAHSDLRVEVQSFFTDVPARLSGCHLLITRSGSSTVAEAMVAGRPTVLIPYQFAADDHQTANAESLQAAGAARVIAQPAFTPAAAAAVLTELLADPAKLAGMAAAAHALAVPDAAERLADLVQSLLGSTPS